MATQPIDSLGSSEEEQTPQDAAGWEDWIANCLAETHRGYRAKPDWLKRDANAEKSIARDYAKRELLELVQNAADAAAEQGGRGRVRIEIRADGLCVANTGMSFRASGVRSLMTAHLSDKPERQAALIGAKGLGFRALLNWSSEPFVTSGALEIGFSRAHAACQIEILAMADERIAALVARSASRLAPILPFPVSGPALKAIDDPKRESLIARARALRAQGYDTVVAAPFDDDKAHKRALNQLAEFRPDFLLFVDTLDQIILDTGDAEPRCWTKLRNASGQFTLEIAQGDRVTAQDWFCRRKTGTLPDPGSPGDVRHYALAIAVRQNGPSLSGPLHCYFPTDIQIPLPALFHATLELDSSRKTLNADSELNAGVLAALAEFYADYLVELRDDPEAPQPLALLARSAAFPEPLQAFEAQLYQAARTRPLILTNGGAFATAEETKVEPLAFAAHLPARFFPALARGGSEADRAVIGRLQVGVLNQADIVAVVRKAEMTIDERARVIVGIAKNLPPELHDRSLLLDTEGKALTHNNTSFPPPVSGTPPVLPWWAKAKFLHPELWHRISHAMGGATRERYDKLQAFGISEFSAAGVIGSLRRQASVILRRKPDDADTIKRELLLALFALRQTVARESAYPVGTTEVLCADGVWRDAAATHFSSAYGGTGQILSALYGWHPARLLADPSAFALPAEAEALAAFFRWIGVQVWPKGVTERLPVEYRPLVIAALPAAFDVVEGNHRRSVQRTELIWEATCKAECDTIDELGGILAHAPSAAILAWLALDPRFDNVQPKPFETRFFAKSGYAAFKRYPGPLPDIVRHMLATRPWLLVTVGERAAPCDTMVSPGPLAALFKAPQKPGPTDEVLFGLTRAIWVRGLAHAQVPARLSDLSEAQIYRLLEGLEARDPPPEVVRRLYGQILQIDEFDPARGGDAGVRFRANGAVQVRKGGAVGWAPVKDVLYLDRDNFPATARERLALLDLPARRGAAEIDARFGVAPLSRQNFSLTVTRAIEDESLTAAHLRTRFHDSLRFIQTLRLATSVDTTKLSRLEALNLVIVREVDLAFSLDAKVFDGELEPGKYLLDGDRLLVCIDPAESDDEILLRALTAMSDGLAEFFELQSGDDFEKLLLAGTNGLRMLQLRRLLDNQTSEEIDAMLAAIETEIAVPDDPYAVDAETLALAITPPPLSTPVPLPGPPGAPPPVPAASGLPSPPAPASAPVPQPSPPPPPPAPPPKATAVIVTKLDCRTTPGAGGNGGGWTGLRIGGTPGPPQRRADVMAPNDAEEWAMLFEESEGRFPLRVSRLQGNGAYGCDCLSFATAADRRSFIEAPQLHAGTIVRFIEVKSGVVRLTRTEQISAQRNRARYFIYQILFDAQGRTTAHLTIVSDPLAYRAAVARECEVRIDQIPDRDRRKLSAVAE